MMHCTQNMAPALMRSSYVQEHYEETHGTPQVQAFLINVTSAEIIEGVITLGNILEILPFEDPTVVLEMDGESLWDALEEGLSKYPAQEGHVLFCICI